VDTDSVSDVDTGPALVEHDAGDIACQNESGEGPWQENLVEWFSEDGTTFTSRRTFQYCADVPSIAEHPDGTLIAVFQSFPDRSNDNIWDKIAVRMSINQEDNWSVATPIELEEFPSGAGRPFDPTITYDPEGNGWRLYFSMSLTGQRRLDGSICTHSAYSTDGRVFTYEPGTRYCAEGRAVIDPAVVVHQETWFYTAPNGAPADGAHFATSIDGLSFTAGGVLSSDKHHNWTGNLVSTSEGLRFYGAESLFTSGNFLWWASSNDAGIAWSDYQQTNIPAGKDPGVTQLHNGSWLILVPTKEK
jgi:beta-xylosidase